MPPWQVSLSVQIFPSKQDVPLGLGAFEHEPVDGLHVAVLHWSLPVQKTGFDPVHTPPWQTFVCRHLFVPVQGMPSSLLASGGQTAEDPVHVSV